MLSITALIGAAVTGAFVYQDWMKKQAQAATPQSDTLAIPRPAFTLPDMKGAPFNINSLDGKVVVINFWATWCPPCRREIPSFNELQKIYGPQGVQFVGVAIDDLEAVQQFMKQTPVGYIVLVSDDKGTEVAQQYGDNEGILPYTVIVDRKGRIAHVKYGEVKRELAEEVIKSLL
jgi:peroxiredoxin